MGDQRPPSIEECLANPEIITAAIRRAVREAVLQHARAGNPVSTWRDGKVVWITPEEILAQIGNEPSPAADTSLLPVVARYPGTGVTMSIRARVEDALLLWEHGRLEGAFLNALVAIAASSRRQFPDRNVIGDREAFERFLEGAMSIRLSAEYRGRCYAVEHIFYKWFRCQLVHEGELPVDIEFMPDSAPGSLSVRAGGPPEYVLKVSRGWFHHLIGAVVTAPVNQDQFRDFKILSGSEPELTRELETELDRRLNALDVNPTDVVTWPSVVEHVKRKR